MKKLFSLILCFCTIFIAKAQLSLITYDSVHTNCSIMDVYAFGAGGMAPYQYSDGGAFTSNNMFTYTSVGTYTITCMDANMATTSSVVTFAPPPIIDSINVVQNLCATPNNPSVVTIFASNTSALTLTPFGGITNPTVGVPFSVFNSGLGSTYTVTAVNANGCVATSNLTVPATNPFIISTVNISTIPCGLSTANIVTSGGTPPYVYSLNGGVGTNAVIPNLPVGSYTLITTDANGCSNSNVFTISPSPISSLNVLATAQSNPCNGNNGTASATVLNGTAPFTYNWSNGQTLANATGLGVGSYTVAITDANGCSGTASISLAQMDFVLDASIDSICPGASTLLTASVNGGNNVTAMPTGYGISSATSTADDEILNVSIGTFSNTSTCATTGGGAANGLPASAVSLYSNYTNLSGINLQQGSSAPISLTLSQCGTSAWQGIAKVWIDFNRNGLLETSELVFTTPVTQNLNTLHSGTINIPATALSGTTLMRVVFEETASANNVNPTGTYTWGETEDYAVNIGYQLQGTTTWSPATGLSSTTGNSVTASPTTTTTYTAITTDPNVCNDTAYVTVTVNNGLVYTNANTVHTNVNCPLSADGSIAIGTTPLANNLTYAWSNGDSSNNNQNIGVGIYSVLIMDTAGGCIVLQDSIISLGLNCGDISGYVKHDSNNNCMYDLGELGIPNTMITVNPGNHITYTDANGDYAINGLPYNTYTITKSNAIGFVNNCGNTTTGSVNAAMPTLVGNYVDSSNLLYNYWVNTWGWCLAPALGNNHRNIYYGHNQAGLASNATVYAVFDSISHYGSSVPAHTSINGDTVFWNLNISGASYLSNYIDVLFNLNPTLPMGLSIPWTIGIINTQHQDSILANNSEYVVFNTCTSYDPNDKTVVPQGKTTDGYITTADEDLTYTIRFQNTGNATAANVVIIDTLSPYLDLTTLQVLHASHPYTIEVINNNLLKFKFLGIMLPDSNADLLGSNGHIAYTIKQNANLAAGTVINNTANIYFDYSAPIITGTTVNTIYDALQAGANNSQANTLCNAVCGNGSVLINANGGVAPLSYAINPACSTTSITGNLVQNLPAGNYIIEITDAIGNVVSNNANVQNNLSAITANANITPIAYNAMGTITAVPSGGVAPYTYNWQPGNTTGNTLSTLQAGTYTLTITDANGCDIVETYTLINGALSIADIGNAANLQVYPNPARDVINIKATVALQQISISNVVGKAILTLDAGASKETIIDVHSLSSGIYQLKLQNGAVRKFVITR